MNFTQPLRVWKLSGRYSLPQDQDAHSRKPSMGFSCISVPWVYVSIGYSKRMKTHFHPCQAFQDLRISLVLSQGLQKFHSVSLASMVIRWTVLINTLTIVTVVVGV